MSAPESPKHVVVVGAGLAGLAAAEALSRHAPELRITVLEARRSAGGRAGSFQDQQSGEEIDYCQHVAMGCCTNWLDFVERCGVSQYLHRYDELTFLHPQHPPSRFAANRWLPPPLHLLGTIGAQHYLSKKQKHEIRLGLWRLMRSTETELRDVTAGDWLRSVGQSENTIADFWEVILVSALGERAERVAMSSARKVLIDGFAAARGASDVFVPTRPLSELFGQLATKTLRDRGVEFHFGQNVRRLEPDGRVRTASECFSADQVICAAPWYRLQSLLRDWPDDTPLPCPDAETFERYPTSAISGMHLWFDRSITERPHAVLVGTTAQWLFRDPTARAPEEDSGEHYFQVVLSASADLTGDRMRLVKTVQRDLAAVFPEARQAQLLRHRLVTDPKSVFSITPAVEASRPATRTAVPWLKLAGDWVATGWPSTMESAVISGRNAAEAVCSDLADGVFPGPVASFCVPELARPWLARLLIRR